MIEKLKKQNTWGECLEKINDIIDIVNKHEDIIRQIGEWGSSKGECLWCENLTAVNLDKRYVEQHQWIGKLCKFWDDDAFVTSKDWALGILTSIDKGMQFQYCCNENCNFKHCEPVKPDDNIIYRGE